MAIELPTHSLVLISGWALKSGSDFARRHFSSALLPAGPDATAASELIAALERRLETRLLGAVDATNLPTAVCERLIATARARHAPVSAILLYQDERERRRRASTHTALDRLAESDIHHLVGGAAIEGAVIRRTANPVDLRDRGGPFDIIGDVHGCADELEELLARLGYRVTWREEPGGWRTPAIEPPPGRTAVFVGDLVDRGPRTPDVLRIAMAMVETGSALAVPGNHDDKLSRWLAGRDVKLAHGLETSVEQLEHEPADFRPQVRAFIEGLPLHLWLAGGELVVAHAGLRGDMVGGQGRAVRAYCLYGDTTGEKDEFGLPVRRNWALEYTGHPRIVYGHTPVLAAEWLNGTLCLDTACCFGGALTALRWPEGELVAVPARRAYAEARRPIVAAAERRS
ncbi:MAG: hypothetical protein GC150_02690 [Rhizobiales bacterium]|nr:hypothetical protein [Hyphomicrobiales bacterium]